MPVRRICFVLHCCWTTARSTTGRQNSLVMSPYASRPSFGKSLGGRSASSTASSTMPWWERPYRAIQTGRHGLRCHFKCKPDLRFSGFAGGHTAFKGKGRSSHLHVVGRRSNWRRDLRRLCGFEGRPGRLLCTITPRTSDRTGSAVRMIMETKYLTGQTIHIDADMT